MKVKFLEKILIIWGLFCGILGMGLYFLGLLGLFYREVIIIYGLICLVILIYILYKQKLLFNRVIIKQFFLEIKKDWLIGVILIGFLVFATLNFIILLAPEVGFDALWYHLTLPKIYLMTHHVSYLPGGLLYYSVMPRLSEMIYGFGLALNPTPMIPKIIHYLFGLSWFGATYLFGRLFLERRYALLAALICYGTYLVTWLSGTAYIDLIVAYYSAMALWGAFKYLQSRQNIYLYLSAIFLGFTLSCKLYGLILLVVLIGLLIFSKTNWKMVLRYAAIALVIVLPFYIQAYIATGNPFYPVFSVKESALAMYTGGYSDLKSWYMEGWWRHLPNLFWEIIIYAFTPIFGLIFLIFFAKNWQKMLPLLLVFLSFFVLWSLNPVQEPRYFMVILPVIATISIYTLVNIKGRIFKILAILLLLVGLVFNFTYGKSKFTETIELVFGKGTKENYMMARLTPPRNFYDFSGNFGREIKNRKVLTVNVHNLFYIDFPFWDWSFIENKYDPNLSAAVMAQDLKNNGYNYVLIGHINAAEWLEVPQTDADQNFKLILKENDFSLYKINE